MTETPVLTKKQQKSSLSAKKTKTREIIRNVLASPYCKYWPLISDEHFELLQPVLLECLPKQLREKIKFDWKPGVPKSERELLRKTFVNQNKEEVIEIKKGMIFGVNDTTKAVEKGTVKSILIAEDVQPKLIVEHLIDQSVLFRIPVLVVPGLRDILKNSCGFPSICIAFTDSVKYEIVQQTIEDISKNYPVPQNHINFKRSLDLVNSSVIIIEDENSEIDSDCNVDNSLEPNADIEDSIPEVHNVYLYRKTKDQRIFVPEKSCNQLKSNTSFQVDPTGFVPFSADSAVNGTKIYTSLSVKKVKGDVNRIKRKIKEMKQKTKQKIPKKMKSKQ